MTKLLQMCLSAFFVAATAMMSMSASAEPMKLRDVLQNRDVGLVCGDSSRVVATLNFLNKQDASPNQCEVYRFIATSATQCGCVREILVGGGKDPAAYMSALGMKAYATSCDTSLPAEEKEPDFCKEGCDCSKPLSWKAYR